MHDSITEKPTNDMPEEITVTAESNTGESSPIASGTVNTDTPRSETPEIIINASAVAPTVDTTDRPVTSTDPTLTDSTPTNTSTNSLIVVPSDKALSKDLRDYTRYQPPTLAKEVTPGFGSRREWGVFTGLTAIASAFIGASSFRWAVDNPLAEPVSGFLFCGVAAVLLIATIVLLRPKVQGMEGDLDLPVPNPYANRQRTRINFMLLLPSVFALLVLAEVGRQRYLTDIRMSIHIQALLFIVGVVGVLFSLGAFYGLNRRALKGLYRWEVGVLLGLTLFGLILRVVNLENSVHILIDETHFWDGLFRITTEPQHPLFRQMGGIGAFPHTFSYMQWWTVEAMGFSFTSMRLISVLFGVLTIPAMYFLGQTLFDRNTGLIAAAVTTIWPPHIHFSRIGLNNISDPLFGVLMVAFLIQALRMNRNRDYVIAGVCLGLASLWYEGGRLLYSGLAIGIIVAALVWGRGLLRHWRGLVLFAFCFALVVIPYYWTLTSENYYFAPRLQTSGAFLTRMLDQLRNGIPVGEIFNLWWVESLRGTLYHLFYVIDGSQLYYGGYTAILIWWLVPFFWLGLIFTIVRTPRSGLLMLGWIVVGVLGISFVVSSQYTVRFVAIFPPIIIFVAAGIRYVVETLWVMPYRRVMWGVVTAIVVVISIANITYYFGPHLELYNKQVRLANRDYYDAYYTVSDYPNISLYFLGISRTQVFDLSLNQDAFFKGKDFTMQVIEDESIITPEWLRALPRDRTLTFAISPDNQRLIDVLRNTFPYVDGPLPRRVDTVPEDRRYAMFALRQGVVFGN